MKQLDVYLNRHFRAVFWFLLTVEEFSFLHHRQVLAEIKALTSLSRRM